MPCMMRLKEPHFRCFPHQIEELRVHHLQSLLLHHRAIYSILFLIKYK